ncbi:FkbM family methyltransferase [Acerihabitans sp. KWT182]|uniref:FkbM family methyltransferase n=1 Tax=Acerihabitans sp. KWT182 TaxID=3157919 RepID=A0AAU7Q9F9_9GAMM
MFNLVKKFIYRAIGLGVLRTEIRSDFTKINSTNNNLNLSSAALSAIDELVQRRLDEKLTQYFRWRMPLSFPEHGKTFIHTNDGHRLYVDPNEPFMTLHLLEHGEWETPVRRELQRELTEGATFVDIGANIGLHTLYAAFLVGEKGRVFSIEPHPVTMAMLRQNLEINGLLERVELAQKAISNVDDATVAFEYFAEHPAMSGLKVSREILDKFNGTLKQINVETITLDSLVSRNNLVPDLVKIDVEGFEYNVLEGCVETILKFPHVRFMMEYGKVMAESVIRPGIGGEIAKFFEDKGFKVSKIQENELAPLTYEQFVAEVGGDYIFAR